MSLGEQIFGERVSDAPMEVLDLRHFSAAQMKPLLRDEAARWERRLGWDYTKSIELLLEYVDGRVLPGYVAMHNGRVKGYTFGVLEGVKAVIGDAYAFGETEGVSNPVCETLLHHLIEMLQASPGVERIESQLLMFPAGALAGPFLSRGFRPYPRLFMVGDVRDALHVDVAGKLPVGLRMDSWQPEFYDAAAELIHHCYAGHTDSGINDQYCSVTGSLRFLHNIIRFPGCGVFDAENSWMLRDVRDGKPQGLLLSSLVRADVAHVTQLCVAPALRGQGLGKMLLQQAAQTLARRGGKTVSLTVTEANVTARRVYEELGYRVGHRFEAMVWESSE
jgi:ribosomal protein S18 acetylase RimI-like enzyme